MRCPFLNEAQVRSCGVSPFRKMILRTESPPADEKCSSPRFVSCPLAVDRSEARPDARSCPFLRETLVQFCSAAPATHFIPYSETILSCCQSGGHRYCDLYVSLAEPERAARRPAGGERPPAPQAGESMGPTQWVDGIDLPARLAFSPNHMWLDLSEDGSCHLGADAFLAKVIGGVEKVSFVAARNVCRPTVVLRVCGVDLTLVFPEHVSVSRSNVHLRGKPDDVVFDPYGRGWLFEGMALPSPAADGPARPFPGLLRGPQALAWMKGETERMTYFVYDVASQAEAQGPRLVNDGGAFRAPVVPGLSPEDRMLLFNAFFSLDGPRGSP